MSETAAPATTATSPLLGGQAQTTNTQTTAVTVPPPAGTWRETLPADLVTSPSLAKFTGVDALAKSYLELEKANSVPKVQIPNETWGKDQWNDFYSKIGRPAKPEEYGFEKPAELPKGITYSEEADKWFAQQAHEAGLTKGQGIKLRDAWNARQTGVAEKAIQTAAETATANEKAMTDLKAEFGPEWNAAIDRAEKTAKAFGGEDFGKYMHSKVGSDPRFIKFLANIGKELTDHRMVRGITSTFGGSGPATAQAEIAKMRADPQAMAILRDPNHQDRPAIYSKWSALHQQLAAVQ